MQKNAQTTVQLHSSCANKVMLKILQARLQQYMNMNFQMFQLDLEKAEEPEIKFPISFGSSKKQESSRKTPTDFVDHNKLWKILKEIGIQTTLPASSEICMQIKKQQLDLDMEQQTGSK